MNGKGSLAYIACEIRYEDSDIAPFHLEDNSSRVFAVAGRAYILAVSFCPVDRAEIHAGLAVAYKKFQMAILQDIIFLVNNGSRVIQHGNVFIIPYRHSVPSLCVDLQCSVGIQSGPVRAVRTLHLHRLGF